MNGLNNDISGWNTEVSTSGSQRSNQRESLNTSFNQFLMQQQMQQNMQQQIQQQIQQQQFQQLKNANSNDSAVQSRQQEPMKAQFSQFDVNFGTQSNMTSSDTKKNFPTQQSLNEIFVSNGKGGNSQKSQQLFLMELQQNLLQQQQNLQQQQKKQHQGQQQGSLQSQAFSAEQGKQTRNTNGQYHLSDAQGFESNPAVRNSGRPTEVQSSNASSGRILLGSEVEPFTRINKQDSDEDLFKLFEEEGEDRRSGTKTSLVRDYGLVYRACFVFSHVLCLRSQQYQYAPQKHQSSLSNQAPYNGYNSSQETYRQLLQRIEQDDKQQLHSQEAETNQRQTAHDFALLRQKEHQEEARLQNLCQLNGNQISQQLTPSLQLDDEEDAFSSQFFVPSTLMPPSVLACSLPMGSRKRKESDDKVFKATKLKRSRQASEPSPQTVFEQLVQKAGFQGSHRIKADDAEYEAIPSALQLASFGTHLVKAVHKSDAETLSNLLKCGLSPNPCNQFRDSVVDLVCKRGNWEIFQCLLDHGTDLQTVDGFGRTPLHHACWASVFSLPIVEAILERDPIQLMIEDKHGQTPLEYVRSDLASDWIEFLEANIHKYWGENVPQLQSPKESRPGGTLPDPPKAVPTNLASLVSAGKVSPEKVLKMVEERKAKGGT
eukprot:scaffold3373_cov137-Cylindrotheca_fusiformis.AAC.5